MAGDIKLKYGTAAAFTVTGLHSLASSTTAGWATDAINNTSTLAMDYLVGGEIILGTTPTTDKSVTIYAFAAYDTTPTYPGIFTGTYAGSNGALTVTDDEERNSGLRELWSSVCDASTNAVHSMPPTSIASVFGCVPPYWALFVLHDTAVNLKSSGSALYYIPVLHQYT